MRFAMTFAAAGEARQNTARVRLRMAHQTFGNGAVRSGMTLSAGDLPVPAAPLGQGVGRFDMTGCAISGVDSAGEGDGKRPVRRMAVLTRLRGAIGKMRQMAFAAGKCFPMAFVAGGAGKTRMHARRGGELFADVRVTIETGRRRFAHQGQAQRPVRIAVADEAGSLALDVPAALMTIAAGPNRLQVAGGMAPMAAQAGEKRLVPGPIIAHRLHLLRMAFSTVGCGQRQIRRRCRRGQPEKQAQTEKQAASPRFFERQPTHFYPRNNARD